MKMHTRSSARLARNNEINLHSRNEFFERNLRQTRKPKPDVYFSDDSENEGTTLSKPKSLSSAQDKSSNRKAKRRVTKFKTTCSDDSGSESNIKHAPLHSRLKKFVTKLEVSDDSEDPCSTSYNRTQILSTPRKQKLRSSSDVDQISCVSPPKQKKTTNEDVPRTPKHNKIERTDAQTPSRLLLNLQLNSPKHSDVIEKNTIGSNRKELFKDNEKTFNENAEQCPQKDIKKTVNVYQSARKALDNTFATDLPGREKELNELREFIRTHIENKTAGSLYISGPPGTGKTASLNIILQDDNISSELRTVYINCTAIKSATAIYSKIAKELEIKIIGKSEKDCLVTVENYLKKESKTILLVLDEIDQLENKNQSILYTIFEWPSKPNSRLILVGIANALDLTDRKLCRLQGHYKLKPKLMHFAPYTKQQILQIFTARLKSVGVLEVFSPAALQILAGKFAAGSGDIRRALDVGRTALGLVDKDEDVLKSVKNFSSGLADKDHEIENQLKTVEVKQVVNVLNNIYGTSQNLDDETDNAFPLQQKIIICSLVLMLKKARNKDITVGKLHEVYKRICKKRNILNVDQAEFVGLCALIETRGIIRVTGKKEPRLNKVNLEWDEEEVAAALKDKRLMSSILQDESCLGKV